MASDVTRRAVRDYRRANWRRPPRPPDLDEREAAIMAALTERFRPGDTVSIRAAASAARCDGKTIQALRGRLKAVGAWPYADSCYTPSRPGWGRN